MTKENETDDENKTHGNKIEINFGELDAMMQFKVTKGFVADWFKCSEDTVEKRIKEQSGMTFTEYNTLKMNRTGFKLQQKAIEMALQGDRTMLIFSLKNMAGWSDKLESELSLNKINITIDNDDNNL